MHENPALARNASRQQSTGVTNSSHHLSTGRLGHDTPLTIAVIDMGLAVEAYARVGELDRAFEMIELLRTMP